MSMPRDRNESINYHNFMPQMEKRERQRKDWKAYPATDSADVHEKLVKRFHEKIDDNRKDIITMEKNYFEDDIDVVIVSYGITSRSTQIAVEQARKEGSLSLSTIGFWIANWFIYNDMIDKARDLLEEILSLDSWASFGYIAAEVTLRDIDR